MLAPLAVGLVLLLPAPLARAETIAELAADFWAWRAIYQPSSGDDIPRLERPEGWTPDWRPETVTRIRGELMAFESRHQAIDPTGWPVGRLNDYRLTGSAIARVRWELDHLAAWRRNPYFYIDQTITPIFEALLPPAPFTKERVQTHPSPSPSKRCRRARLPGTSRAHRGGQPASSRRASSWSRTPAS